MDVIRRSPIWGCPVRDVCSSKHPCVLLVGACGLGFGRARYTALATPLLLRSIFLPFCQVHFGHFPPFVFPSRSNIAIWSLFVRFGCPFCTRRPTQFLSIFLCRLRLASRSSIPSTPSSPHSPSPFLLCSCVIPGQGPSRFSSQFFPRRPRPRRRLACLFCIFFSFRRRLALCSHLLARLRTPSLPTFLFRAVPILTLGFFFSGRRFTHPFDGIPVSSPNPSLLLPPSSAGFGEVCISFSSSEVALYSGSLAVPPQMEASLSFGMEHTEPLSMRYFLALTSYFLAPSGLSRVL